MSPARSLTCWVAFTEPSVFFFDIFSCIRRCARLSCGAGAGATTSASAEVCMRRSPHVARRESIDARPRGAGEKAAADITCRSLCYWPDTVAGLTATAATSGHVSFGSGERACAASKRQRTMAATSTRTVRKSAAMLGPALRCVYCKLF